jgi:hypothetical protein
MWHEKENVDEEGQQGDKKGRKQENEYTEQVTSGVRRRVKMSCRGKGQYDEVQKSGDGMNNEE